MKKCEKKLALFFLRVSCSQGGETLFRINNEEQRDVHGHPLNVVSKFRF